MLRGTFPASEESRAKEIACRDAGYDCDFEIRSENEDELIEFVQEHARETHKSSDDIRGTWSSV